MLNSSILVVMSRFLNETPWAYENITKKSVIFYKRQDKVYSILSPSVGNLISVSLLLFNQ